MKSESFSPPPDSLASTLPITSSSHSKIWLVNLKTAVKELEIPVQGIIVLGRGVGSLKECTDKRLSRHHAELSVQNPSRGIALLISCGTNPIYVTTKVGNKRLNLSQGQKYLLRNGDQFDLIEGEYSYRVDYEDYKRKFQEDSDEEIISQKKTKKPKLNDSEEEEIKATLIEVESKVSSKEEEKDEILVQITSNQKEKKRDTEVESSTKSKKIPCKYGSKCFQKDAKHLKKYSHPNEANDNPSTDSSGVSSKEECKFGSSCHKNDPKHKEKYSHSASISLSNPKVIIYKGECKYGEKCYNNDPKHLETYYHSSTKPSTNETNENSSKSKEEEEPMEENEAEEEGFIEDHDGKEELSAKEEMEDEDEEMIGVKPLHTLKEGIKVKIEGDSGTYEIMKKAGVYSCTCTAWKQQSLGLDERTCKHLRKYLGEEFETARTGQAHPKTVQKSKFKTKNIPALLLAQKWEASMDPTDWWISEKLDGVRAFWDGKEFLISRLGNPFAAPEWFLAQLPKDLPLDGELWLDRQMFQRTVAIVRSQAKDKYWKEITFKVFDAPKLDKTFEERMEFLKSYFAKNPSKSINLVDQEKCKGIVHLKKKLAEVEKLGGEGLMLRQPLSKYVGNRSSTLLKVKSFFDAEAKVIRHEPGKGKYKGLCGALFCELPNGKHFAVGSGLSDQDRRNPPPVGSIITYRYQELTEAGIPRFPTFVAIRTDIEWPPKDSDPPKQSTPKLKSQNKSVNKNTKNNNDYIDPEEENPSPKPKVINKKPKEITIANPEETSSSSSPSTCFEGITFVFTGTHSLVRRELVDLIALHGGVTKNSITKNVNFLVSTKSELLIETAKVTKAKSYGIPIISETFIHECIKRRKLVDHTKYSPQ